MALFPPNGPRCLWKPLKTRNLLPSWARGVLLTFRNFVDIVASKVLGATAIMNRTSIEDLVTKAMGGIAEVESVYLSPSGSTLNVYTVIDLDDDRVRDSIYDQEAYILKSLADSELCFDFNVIARRGRPIGELVGECSPIWQRSGAASACHNLTSI